jgi:hypothetical protein
MLVNDVSHQMREDSPLSISQLVETYYLPELMKNASPTKFILYKREYFKLSAIGNLLLSLVNEYKAVLHHIYTEIQTQGIPLILKWSNLQRKQPFSSSFWNYICHCISWTDKQTEKHELLLASFLLPP